MAAFPILHAQEDGDLFKAYGVLNKAEVDSRFHISVEKYVKQMGIEADTMVSMARGQILPAAIEHQRRLAEAVAATKAAGVDPGESLTALKEFVVLVDELRRHTTDVERAAAHHEADPMRHASSINRDLKPKMARLRAAGDQIESLVPASVWPLPTYRDLLFLK